MSELHQDCRFLDYDEGRYAGSGCILMKEPGGYWWWKRPEHYPGAPVAAQFCQRYGRINQKGDCWGPGFKSCFEPQAGNLS